MDYGFKYIIANRGITCEELYPYKAMDQNCNKVLERATCSKIK